MSYLDEFKRNQRFAVCVDSDGCAMDTMNIKHIRCFGPCMVEEWGLAEWRDAILERWNEINLYSGTRGINRFKGLAMALAEIHEQYAPIDGIDLLVAWAETAPELSNDAVALKAQEHPVFEKALRWSRAVNAAIEALPEEEVKPFAVRYSYASSKLSTFIRMIVISRGTSACATSTWKPFASFMVTLEIFLPSTFVLLWRLSKPRASKSSMAGASSLVTISGLKLVIFMFSSILCNY